MVVGGLGSEHQRSGRCVYAYAVAGIGAKDVEHAVAHIDAVGVGRSGCLGHLCHAAQLQEETPGNVGRRS